MDGELDDMSRISSRESSHKELDTSKTSLKCSDRTSTSSKLSVKIKDAKEDMKDKKSGEHDEESIGSVCSTDTPHKVPNKIIANWRHACDRTRDRTRDLLKRWRTLPEFDPNATSGNNIQTPIDNVKEGSQQQESGWSVHVWSKESKAFAFHAQQLVLHLSNKTIGLIILSTWVDRFSIDMDGGDNEGVYQLTPIQSNKFTHFFTSLLDHDHDELITEQDIQALIERLRHFADWDTYSTEYNILREIERGFLDTFLKDIPDDKFGFQVNNKYSYLTLEGWLYKWAQMISGTKNLSDFPIWLQYFVKVLFQVINRSSSGIITRDELSAFYSSVLCLDTTKVGEILDVSYQAMTSNGDHALSFKAYRLCFSNYLLGRYPNGPGQYIFGAPPLPMASALFPVDYSALNAQPEDLEQYAPDGKTTRRSVIV